MELKDLITKIKNFNNTIISEKEYMNPLSDNYLFTNEYTIYEGVEINKKSDDEKLNIAISTMLQQIKQELNIIDIELFDLRITKPTEYKIICVELIPDLISTLKQKYSKYSPFGWENIEKHYENKIVNINQDLEISTHNEIELVKQKDKVALINALGIIELLEKKYPYIKGNGQRTTKLLMQFLDIQESSLQPIINALLNNTTTNKNYPKLTQTVQSVINKYTLEK